MVAGSVTFEVRRTIGSAVETVGSYTLSSDDDWQKTIDDLPENDDAGAPCTYSVVETGFTVNGTQYAVDENGTITAAATGQVVSGHLIQPPKVQSKPPLRGHG